MLELRSETLRLTALLMETKDVEAKALKLEDEEALVKTEAFILIDRDTLEVAETPMLNAADTIVEDKSLALKDLDKLVGAEELMLWEEDTRVEVGMSKLVD